MCGDFTVRIDPRRSWNMKLEISKSGITWNRAEPGKVLVFRLTSTGSSVFTDG